MDSVKTNQNIGETNGIQDNSQEKKLSSPDSSLGTTIDEEDQQEEGNCLGQETQGMDLRPVEIYIFV